jgi:hypothetical protein
MARTTRTSPAKRREAEAVQELRDAVDKVNRASSKFRADSTATILSGMLHAATGIIDNVADTIEQRTEED